jgi:hypothetical protein
MRQPARGPAGGPEPEPSLAVVPVKNADRPFPGKLSKSYGDGWNNLMRVHDVKVAFGTGTSKPFT